MGGRPNPTTPRATTDARLVPRVYVAAWASTLSCAACCETGSRSATTSSTGWLGPIIAAGHDRATEVDRRHGSTARPFRSHHPTPRAPGPLAGIRVIELADEQAEYCGLTLAGLGAEVIKIEPPGGNSTRRIGPFYEDKEDPERSLFFWQYNRGKRSIVLDLQQQKDRERFRALVASADILLESTPKGELDALGMGKEALRESFPTLIHARVTPFGDDGPWADFKASRSRASRARRRHDELRLRSRPRRQVRPAADRAADVARVSHRRRAALLRASSPRCSIASARARASSSRARCTSRSRNPPRSIS